MSIGVFPSAFRSVSHPAKSEKPPLAGKPGFVAVSLDSIFIPAVSGEQRTNETYGQTVKFSGISPAGA